MTTWIFLFGPTAVVLSIFAGAWWYVNRGRSR